MLVDKLELVEHLRLVGASEILAVARVKSCQSARLNQPCRLVQLPALRAAKSSAGFARQIPNLSVLETFATHVKKPLQVSGAVEKKQCF